MTNADENQNQSSKPQLSPALLFSGQTALFDATHGQANWSQTGFSSREMHSNFAGMMQTLCQMGFTCTTTIEKPLSRLLPRTKLLVIPPPTGRYVARKQRWIKESSSLFAAREIRDILVFLRNGGRLLAFAYRFGDSLTQTNLRDLFSTLGCLLNDDAVIDVTTLRTTHPLKSHIETPVETLPLVWSRPDVEQLRWRSMATFTILPGATIQPLVCSPGGRCIAFDRIHRQISFASLPIAVAGFHGKGRFVIFGGPHAFETGIFGLLKEADNERFLQNVLQWLLDQERGGMETQLTPPGLGWQHPYGDVGCEFSQVEGRGIGRQTIDSVERLLRKTGVLKALSRPKWMP